MGREDQIKLELGLLTDEYKALKAEIVSNLVSARQILGIAFAAIGALIAGGRVIFESGQTTLFLVVPVFFYALVWAQLRYVFLVLDMGAYLRCILAPRIHQLLADLSRNRSNFGHILSWEAPGKSPIRGRSNFLFKILFIPIAGANFGIPLLAAMSSVAVFFIFHKSDTGISNGQFILLVLNLIAFIYSAAWGWVADQRR